MYFNCLGIKILKKGVDLLFFEEYLAKYFGKKYVSFLSF